MGIFGYLKYKVRRNKKGDVSMDTEDLKWYTKNIKFFDNLLNNINKQNTFLTPDYIFVQNEYLCKQYDNVSTVGHISSRFTLS